MSLQTAGGAMPEAVGPTVPTGYQTIPELLATRAPEVGRIALAAPARIPLDYAGLAEQVARVAHELALLGAADRPVAIMLPNGPELAVAFLAAASAGSAAPLNPA